MEAYNQPYFEKRNGDWFCLLCEKWAPHSHITSRKHNNKAWYYHSTPSPDSSSMPLLKQFHEMQKTSSKIWEGPPAEERWAAFRFVGRIPVHFWIHSKTCKRNVKATIFNQNPLEQYRFWVPGLAGSARDSKKLRFFIKVLWRNVGFDCQGWPGAAGIEKVTILIKNPLEKYRFWEPGLAGSGRDWKK